MDLFLIRRSLVCTKQFLYFACSSNRVLSRNMSTSNDWKSKASIYEFKAKNIDGDDVRKFVLIFI